MIQWLEIKYLSWALKGGGEIGSLLQQAFSSVQSASLQPSAAASDESKTAEAPKQQQMQQMVVSKLESDSKANQQIVVSSPNQQMLQASPSPSLSQSTETGSPRKRAASLSPLSPSQKRLAVLHAHTANRQMSRTPSSGSLTILTLLCHHYSVLF